MEGALKGIYSLQDAWRHAGKPPGVGICSHFVHFSAKVSCHLQTGGLHFCRLNRGERLKLALFLAKPMHRPSEVALQPAVGSGTMSGIHVYGQKARLSNSGFVNVL